MPFDEKEKEQQKNLHSLVNDIVKCDDSLRQKYKVGNKFKFIKEGLKEIVDTLVISSESDKNENGVYALDEKITDKDRCQVFVHLFNAKGDLFSNWINMLGPKVFYEYSINRPIYLNEKEVKQVIKCKSDKLKHAYLIVSLKKIDIISSENQEVKKDSLGGVLIKVKEGSLKVENLITFMHNEKEYTLNRDNILKIK
ncbi:type IVB secretion system protein IcmQ [Gammaproteobacteria bacterium]|nr:type IVB secretion system protein IcmQ [Gammaproteobacteria bacterium]